MKVYIHFMINKYADQMKFFELRVAVSIVNASDPTHTLHWMLLWVIYYFLWNASNFLHTTPIRWYVYAVL
jgi:hypothetical protein